MSDVWSAVKELDVDTQERLAGVLETRGADPQQQAMRRAFLAEVPIPAHARVVEVGCGTGALTRLLASCQTVDEVVGIDLAPSLLAKAQTLATGFAKVSFREADARALPLDSESVDVVIFDSTLCHVPGPEQALAEAHRVLRPGACLAIFDGDYATTTVGLGSHDPLQACVDAMMASSVNDRWLVRRLPALVRGAGFEIAHFRGHSFVETAEATYMLTVIDRGADILTASGEISLAAAAALKAEARQRVQLGTFFGHIAYASITARQLPLTP
jgi:SAM-dependent methyltransferase